jgi:ABC-type glycerol-3-phosphate transport system permease component
MSESGLTLNHRLTDARQVRRQERRFGLSLSRLLLYLMDAGGIVIFSIPFLWMLRSSVMPLWQIRIFPPQWWPAEFHWANFTDPFSTLPFARFYANSIYVTLMNMAGTLVSSSLVAYGFARLRFPGRNILFLLVLSSMMLPSHVTLIPKYVLFTKLGWVDSFMPLIVPAWFGGNPFIIFLLRQFMLGISTEIEDAARIDGCNRLQTFWHVGLPLSLPALGVASIFEFISNWMNFFEPLIYLNSTDKFTVPLGLAWLQRQGHIGVHMDVVAGPLMAQSLIFLVPMLITFYLAQRYLIRGIVLTGQR